MVLTYKDVAVSAAFDLSEPNIKRIINSGNYTLKQLEKLGELIGVSMIELLIKADEAIPKLKQFTSEQQQQLWLIKSDY